MIVQFRLCLVILLQRQVSSKAWHRDMIDNMSDRSIVSCCKVCDQLTSKEIIVNPASRVDPSLLALQDFSIKLFRLCQIIGGNSVMKRFVCDFCLHELERYFDIKVNLSRI